MTEPQTPFDRLFLESARLAFDPEKVPHAELWRASQLGFDEAFGRITLSRHTWLAFLNRLWDSHRTGGLPDGPLRVPERIWGLAAQDTDQGRLHRDLLEATGLRQPPDFEDHLECHLTLWRQDALAGAARAQGLAGGEPGDEEPAEWHADGPVSLDVVPTDQGWHVELTAALPGGYLIEIHSCDTTISHQTPDLTAGQTYAFDYPGDMADAPQSVRITRRKTS